MFLVKKNRFVDKEEKKKREIFFSTLTFKAFPQKNDVDKSIIGQKTIIII